MFIRGVVELSGVGEWGSRAEEWHLGKLFNEGGNAIYVTYYLQNYNIFRVSSASAKQRTDEFIE